jgi:hypothetical protein
MVPSPAAGYHEKADGCGLHRDGETRKSSFCTQSYPSNLEEFRDDTEAGDPYLSFATEIRYVCSKGWIYHWN